MSSPPSDAPYKLLFSSPRMVADLIRGFVPDPWLSRFDPTSLLPAPTNHITPRLRQLHSDLVWHLQAPDEQGEVIVHIEFQSRPRPDMPLRMLEYLAHILKARIADAQRPLPHGWPPVLSIVVYNGKPRWGGSHRLADHFRRMPRGWLRHSLQHRFVLVDIHRQSPQHLAKLDNLVALIMRLELPHQSAEVAQVLLRLNQKLAIQDPLRELIRTWVLARVSDSSSISHLLDEFVNAKGTAMSVNENFQNFFRDLTQSAHAKGIKKGRREGLNEGRSEGRLEGQAAILSHLLARRFGPLDDATQSRLMSANPRQMKQWAERILTATRLEDVFKSRH